MLEVFSVYSVNLVKNVDVDVDVDVDVNVNVDVDDHRPMFNGEGKTWGACSCTNTIPM